MKLQAKSSFNIDIKFKEKVWQFVHLRYHKSRGAQKGVGFNLSLFLPEKWEKVKSNKIHI